MKIMLSIFILGLISSLLGCSNPTTKFEPIVKQIKEGSLKPNSSGGIIVPNDFGAELGGTEIYFEKKDDGLILILFPTAVGRGDDFEGYLYCSRDLQPADFYTINWGEGGIRQNLDVATKNMLTVEPFKLNWYRVSRRLD